MTVEIGMRGHDDCVGGVDESVETHRFCRKNGDDRYGQNFAPSVVSQAFHNERLESNGIFQDIDSFPS